MIFVRSTINYNTGSDITVSGPYPYDLKAEFMCSTDSIRACYHAIDHTRSIEALRLKNMLGGLLNIPPIPNGSPLAVGKSQAPTPKIKERKFLS